MKYSTYMSVMITYFETVPSISCGSIYVSAADGKLKQVYNVSVKEAEKEQAARQRYADIEKELSSIQYQVTQYVTKLL